MSVLHEWLQAAMAGGSGGRHALVHRDTYLSWLGLHHRVERRVRDLAGMGIAEGDLVGLMVGNVPESVVLLLALSRLDAVPVPLDPTVGGRDLDMILAAAPLRGLVTRPNAVDPLAAPTGTLRLEPAALCPRVAVESRRRLPGTLLGCSIFARRPLAPAAGTRPEVILFTLDAGGDPKGVVRGRTQLEGVGAALGSTLVLDARSQVLCTAPLHSSQGFDLGLCAALARGGTLFLEDETAEPRLLKLMLDHHIDLHAATPAAFAAMARVPTARPFGKRPPRLLSSGSPLPAAVARTFRQRLHASLHSCYHTLESGPLSLDESGDAPTTVGKPFAGVELRVGDGGEANGARAIWARGGGVCTRFVPEVKLRRRGSEVPVGRAGTDGWLRTGDLGSFDRGGRLVLAGREDDLVEVDGRRVALGEVEACLEAFAHVRTAEARVEHDEAGAARVVARVVRDGRCTAKELLDHCARRLAPHKVPARIEFVANRVPEPCPDAPRPATPGDPARGAR
jgi:fatty-acyl-CoA synthase